MSVKFPPELQFEPSPVNLDPRSPEPEYSGFIILRLNREVVSQLNQPPFSQLNTLREIVAATQSDELSRLLAVIEKRGEVPTSRLISGVPPEQIVALEARAANGKFPPLNSLTAYFRLDLRQLPEAQAALVDDLNPFPSVDLVYREQVANNPTFTGNAGNLYLGLQRYLNGALEGVNGLSTLGQPSGQGDGIRFVDLELDWNPGHEDLAALPNLLSPNPLVGDRSTAAEDIDHGTAVLSIVAAVNNGIGGVGIAPNVASIGLASHFLSSLGSDGHVANAIITLLTNPAALNTGDVLLLEVQRGVLPVETDAADYDAIRLASAGGIIVIEAAGNGNQNIDGLLNPEDSGAIMVGASTASIVPPSLSHGRYVGCGIGCGSNFGTRVNCYAWGEFILSASSLIPAPAPPYHTNFGGTSGAAAIIAGVALVVQGLQAAGGLRLTNTEMRLLLSDPSHGTPSANASDLIGVMPDLARLTTTLGLSPIILMRRTAGDMGEIRCDTQFGLSPDIIVSPKPLPTPYSGHGYEPGCRVTTDQNHYIYVQAQNLGNLPANRVTATVYLGEPSALPNPQAWQKIGTTQPICLPEHSGLITLPPIIWQIDERLRGYTLFAVIDSAENPAPPLPTAPETPLQDIQNFINYRNNVAATSVTSVEITAGAVTLPFVVTGSSDCELTSQRSRYRSFDLSILQRLPPSATTVWTIPDSLFEQIPTDFCVEVEHDPKNERVRLRLPPWQSLSLRNIQLPMSARFVTELAIQGIDPETVAQRNYSLAVRQLSQGQEVGRLTWQLRRPQSPKKQPSPIVRLLLRLAKWLDH